VEYGGRTITCGQSNNMYLFPGIALGGWLAGGGIITDGMLDVAAETLPKLLTEEDLAEGRVYPQLKVGSVTCSGLLTPWQ
jgi:malic enzyme